jgi:hypothetical protein
MIAANILNKQLPTAGKGLSSCLGLGVGLTTPQCKSKRVTKVHHKTPSSHPKPAGSICKNSTYQSVQVSIQSQTYTLCLPCLGSCHFVL